MSNADISNVINVALLPEGELVARDNMNVCAVMTSQQDGPLSSANRFALYSNAADVAAAFGTASQIAAHANVFFSTTPNPSVAGGVFVAGYWRGASEDVAATAGILRGAALAPVTVIGTLQGISDASFVVSVDGSPVSVTGLSFQSVTTLDEVAALLEAQITGTTVTATGDRITVTSDTTGALSEVGLITPEASGTFIGDVLKLSAGTGAVSTDGLAADTLTAETKVDAVTALKALVNFKGVAFIDSTTSERVALAAWSKANSVLMYDVFSDTSNLLITPANDVWTIKLAGHNTFRMLYSKAGNRQLATSYMARMHVVNFAAENSALTMQLKQLAVPAESYSQTEITAAKNVGLDLYVTVKDRPTLLTSGANDFTDNPYNLIAFIDAVQTDQFNHLAATSTKISQTTQGVQSMVAAAEKTTRGFVRSGVFAAGEWSSPDSFGDVDVFKRSIRTNGFYWLAGELADQAQVDRAARKSPVLQGAVKAAGAVHSADIIINFNR